jgi:flagella basal body P-ring formation protein FlgA
MARAPEQVVGQRLRRPIGADMPVLLADLTAPALVEKNALVTLVLEAPGMQLAAQGRALEGGARGGLVPVMNLSSRAVVEGVVVGPGRVRVALGTAPVSDPR